MCGHNVIIRPSNGHILYDMNTKELLNKGRCFYRESCLDWFELYFLKGAKVLNDSIIGANSLVNKKFYEKNVIIAGKSLQKLSNVMLIRIGKVLNDMMSSLGIKK